FFPRKGVREHSAGPPEKRCLTPVFYGGKRCLTPVSWSAARVDHEMPLRLAADALGHQLPADDQAMLHAAQPRRPRGERDRYALADRAIGAGLRLAERVLDLVRLAARKEREDVLEQAADLSRRVFPHEIDRCTGRLDDALEAPVVRSRAQRNDRVRALRTVHGSSVDL